MALRDGAVDFVGGSAHSALAAFPQWDGVKLICAQAQGMYWFLVMHKDFAARRGDIGAVKGKSIGAAPWVDMGLRRLLIAAGIDLARDGVTIAPVPGAVRRRRQFRPDRGEGAGRTQDRRLLGERHGRRSCGPPRHRRRRARRPARRRAERLLRLHDGIDRDHRPPDRKIARGRGGRGARHGQDANCAEEKRRARGRGRPQAVSTRAKPN